MGFPLMPFVLFFALLVAPTAATETRCVGGEVAKPFSLLQSKRLLPAEFTQRTVDEAPMAGQSSAKETLQKGNVRSKLEMFVDLSDMLPGNGGACPDIDGIDSALFGGAEIKLCRNMIQRDETAGKCLVYNFGVADHDDFLDQLTKTFKDCQVFAFDPFYHVSEVPHFPPNVKFFSWGLWNGEGKRVENRTSKMGQTYESRFMSMAEIQEELGHKGKQISVVRTDCEGCEWGWVAQAMKDDATMFERISQMFIEVHTVHVNGMASMQQTWEDGLPPNSSESVPPLYHMMTDHFMVLESRANPGYPVDRNKVPEHLQRAGVLQYPCCREFNLINKADGVAPFPSLVDLTAPRSQMTSEVNEKFKGNQDSCTVGKVETVGSLKFCPDMLRQAMSNRHCLIYHFGLRTDDEIRFVQLLDRDYKDCAVMAFEPEKTAVEFQQMGFGAQVKFFPWGIYTGTGHRVVQKGDKVEELYTLKEILNAWTPGDTPKDVSPTTITLLRSDFERTPWQVWQKEAQTSSWQWWGQFSGLKSIDQMC